MRDYQVEDFSKFTREQLAKIDNRELIIDAHKKAFKYTNQQRRALDVGCKFGFYAELLVKDFMYVDCFDMRNKMRNNILAQENLRFQSIAIGDKNSTVTYQGDVIDYVADKTKPVSYTKQITLDSLNYNDVDYIKIDTEGHELKVLQGCEETLKRTHPVIVLEQNDTVVRYGKGVMYDAIDWLRQRDYKLVEHNGLDDWIMAFVDT